MRFGPLSSTLLLLILSCEAFAQPASVPDPLADPGFQHFYNLEYDDAMRVFEARIGANPSDPSARTALAQTILYYEMFRNRALDSDLIGSSNPFVTRPHLKVTPEHQREFQTSISRAM